MNKHYKKKIINVIVEFVLHLKVVKSVVQHLKHI